MKKILKWISSAFVRVIDFLALTEDRQEGQRVRLSQTKIMVWGAMLAGVVLILSVQISDEPMTMTDAGLIGLLTTAASVMKWARDSRQGEHDSDEL